MVQRRVLQRQQLPVPHRDLPHPYLPDPHRVLALPCPWPLARERPRLPVPVELAPVVVEELYNTTDRKGKEAERENKMNDRERLL